MDRCSLSELRDRHRSTPFPCTSVKLPPLKKILMIGGDTSLGGLGDAIYTWSGLATSLHDKFPQAQIEIANLSTPWDIPELPRWVALRSIGQEEEFTNYDLVIAYSGSDILCESVLSKSRSALVPFYRDSFYPNENGENIFGSWLYKSEHGNFSTLNPITHVRNLPFFYGYELPERMGLSHSKQKTPFLIANDISCSALYKSIEEDAPPCFIINPFSHNNEKEVYLMDLFDQMKKNYIEGVVCTGTRPYDFSYTKYLTRTYPSVIASPIRSLSLSETIRLINKFPVLIGVDTATTHIAAALGIPSITLFNERTAGADGEFSYFDIPAFGFDFNNQINSSSQREKSYAVFNLAMFITYIQYGGFNDIFQSMEQGFVNAKRALDLIEELKRSPSQELAEQTTNKLLEVLNALTFIITPLASSFREDLERIKNSLRAQETIEIVTFKIRNSNFYKFLRFACLSYERKHSKIQSMAVNQTGYLSTYAHNFS